LKNGAANFLLIQAVSGKNKGRIYNALSMKADYNYSGHSIVPFPGYMVIARNGQTSGKQSLHGEAILCRLRVLIFFNEILISI
jgi:hypothetical protein